MIYNLTEKQKKLARYLVGQIECGGLEESFDVLYGDTIGFTDGTFGSEPFLTSGALNALANESLLILEGKGGDAFRCTVTGQLFAAVGGNFSADDSVQPLSTLAHAAPPELNLSLDRLRKKYPDPAKLGFLVMRFVEGKAFGEIVKAIQDTAAKHGISIIRADEHEFHADLWGNVRTFLHGCSFGVAVYERIEQDEPNANVGLEVGYLLAMNKPVLLLKERTVKTLQADLMGKLYKTFDEHHPAETIPEQLERWLTDNGVIVPGER